jgi:hypothetical protein
MKANINILDTGEDTTMTWSRRFRFVYNSRAAVRVDLSWNGEDYGYSLDIEDIECYDEDPSAEREVEEAVHAWAKDLRQSDLYDLDTQTEYARQAMLGVK